MERVVTQSLWRTTALERGVGTSLYPPWHLEGMRRHVSKDLYLFLSACSDCKHPSGGGGYVHNTQLLRTSLESWKLKKKTPSSRKGCKMANCSNILCVPERLWLLDLQPVSISSLAERRSWSGYATEKGLFCTSSQWVPEIFSSIYILLASTGVDLSCARCC